MKNKIKLLKAQHIDELDNIINAYIDNGWKFKGELVAYHYFLIAIVYKG